MLDLDVIKDYLKQAERFPLSLAVGVANYARLLVEEVERLRLQIADLERKEDLE